MMDVLFLVASVLQRGKFGHGFASGGIGAYTGSAKWLQGADCSALRIGVSAIVGGTVSDATGWKFANGAVTAAFSAAVSEGVRAGLSKQNNKTGFNSEDDTGRAALREIHEISKDENAEYGGLTYKKEVNGKVKYFYTTAVIGDHNSISVRDIVESAMAEGEPWDENVTGMYHTHADADPAYNNEEFSKGVLVRLEMNTEFDFDASGKMVSRLVSNPIYTGDIDVAKKFSLNSYLSTSSDRLKKYNLVTDKAEDLSGLYDD